MNENDDLLVVDVATVDHDVIITVAGELDPHTAPRLNAGLAAAEEEGIERVVLDLSAVTFIDSSGLQVILTALDHFTTRGVDFVLRSPSAAVHRLLEITDLLRRLHVE